MGDDGTCVSCETPPPINYRFCGVCQTDVGFPNVRLAQSRAERDALASRLRTARARAGHARDAGQRLRKLVREAEVVFNRHLMTLQNWLLADTPQFLTFYDQMKAGRVPKDDTWERQRTSAENSVNPLYYPKLSVAAIGPSGRGLSYYGPYTVSLKKETVVHRSTVFETNPFFFCRQHSIVSGADAPPGYRAAWKNRESLALAKLADKIGPSMTEADLADLLQEPRSNEADCDFIEVHIYGPIHRASIASVSGPVPEDPDDAIVWTQVKRRLIQLDVTVVETP